MIFVQRPAALSFLFSILFLAVLASGGPAFGQSNDSVTAPVKTLRLAIHVFQDDSGEGNFRADNAGHVAFLKQLTDWVNHRLANLDTLKPAFSSPFVADTKVRIRLDTIFYHQDSRAWDSSIEIDSPYMRDRYVDGDSTLSYLLKYQTLPVFIGANYPVAGGHSRNLGDRGFIAVRGYFENYTRRPFSQAIDECGRNLVHELGHCLGLGHNFTGGAGGDQCDICEDNGCPVEGTSNNIMDYWPSYGYAISKCQFDLIQMYLRGERGNISEVVINDSCYKEVGIGYRVLGAGDTVHVNRVEYAHKDILIENGGVLRVTGYLSMPGDAVIEVESGGQLMIDGGTIGNLCGDLWDGIRISGAAAEGQKAIIRNPAMVSIINGGKVENALAGLTANGRIVTEVNNATFANCVESLVFKPGSTDSLYVANSTFIITSKLNHYEEGLTPVSFISTLGIPRLVVSLSHFTNEPGTFIFDADWMGTGIQSDAGFIQIGLSDFRNLTTAVNLFSHDTSSKFKVIDNQFFDNRYGLISNCAGIQWIEGNRLVLQRFNSGGTVGLFLRHPDRFAVVRNDFKSVYGGGSLAGLVISDPSVENSAVFNNKFSNLPVGAFMDGTPDIQYSLFEWANNSGSMDDLKTGPQLRFNEFDTVSLHFAVVADSICGNAIGKPEDNAPERSVPATSWSTGGYAWYSDHVSMVAFDGWGKVSDKTPDHGFYWFMNYLGTVSDGAALPGDEPRDYNALKDYLNKIASIDESAGQYFGSEVFEALNKAVQMPAALRSVVLAGYWDQYKAEQQTWLRESLASIAARFVRADTLLTKLGTELSTRNLAIWNSHDSTGKLEFQYTGNFPEEPRFVFPDLTAFRFYRSEQQESGLPGFLIYPNPAQEYILIQPREGYTFGTTWEGSVFSADGKYVKKLRIGSWMEQRIAISDLPAGLYIMELFSGIQYLGTVKFVKTKHR